jgi:phosphatidate phosphatase PAH1
MSPASPVSSPSAKHRSIIFSLGRKIAEKKINHTREATDVDVSPQGNPIKNTEVLKKIEQGEKGKHKQYVDSQLELKSKKRRIHRHSMAHNPTIIIEPPAPGSTITTTKTMRTSSGDHIITTTTTTSSRISDSIMQRIEEEYPPVAETIPPAEYLSKLPLDKEVNTVRFLISATGENSFATIFKWDDNTKMVVSDVDGTITKSDIKGHIYTRLGRVDYTHEGISSLYTQIASNGYKFLYLTARPIGQVSRDNGVANNLG